MTMPASVPSPHDAPDGHEPEEVVEGSVDALTEDTVFGWVWVPEDPDRRVTVELLLGGAVAATVTADEERDDLLANAIGDGRHAFSYRFPAEAGYSPDTVEVRVAGSGAPLPMVAQAAAVRRSVDLFKRLDRIEADLRRIVPFLRGLRAEVAGLKGREADLRRDVTDAEAGLLRLDGQVRALTEALAERPPATRTRTLVLAFIASIVCGGLAGVLAALLLRT